VTWSSVEELIFESRRRRVVIAGLSHMTFIVRDLDRMEEVLIRIFHARRVYDSGDRTFSLSKERFFLIGGEPGDRDAPAPIWIAIMEGESLPSRTYNHVAFRIDETDYDPCLRRIRSLGLDVREGRSRVEGEGHSIYFHDHDNHLFELHTGTLSSRLACYEQRPH
jgi:catechol 2,3-dioxygenase-like lactoylglutathione lyase family enzyme